MRNDFRHKSIHSAAAIYIVVFVCLSAFAKLMGEGEATGGVFQSWVAGDRVVFRLDIAEQKHNSGPSLGSPNIFVYGGADRMEITEGDTIRLTYKSDDSDGIIVERLEFLDNRPGAVGQTRNLSLLIIVGSVLFGIVLVLAGTIYQKFRIRRRKA